MDEEKKEAETLKLSEQEALALELHKERIVSAESALRLRKTEMQLLLDRLIKQAEENGKYRVVGLDPVEGIKRVAN